MRRPPLSLRIARPILLLVALLSALPLPGQDQEVAFELEGELEVDLKTGETVARQGARLTYGPWLLAADEIRYNEKTGEAEAISNVVLTRQGLRLVADRVIYRPLEPFAHIENFRAGNGEVINSVVTALTQADDVVNFKRLVDNALPTPFTLAARIQNAGVEQLQGEAPGNALRFRPLVEGISVFFLYRTHQDKIILLLTLRSGLCGENAHHRDTKYTEHYCQDCSLLTNASGKLSHQIKATHEQWLKLMNRSDVIVLSRPPVQSHPGR